MPYQGQTKEEEWMQENRRRNKKTPNGEILGSYKQPPSQSSFRRYSKSKHYFARVCTGTNCVPLL